MITALNFASPPPGFEPLLDFTLTGIDGATGLYSLRADEDVDLRLFVLDANVYLPHYHPEISVEQSDSVGIDSADDAAVLVVANPDSEGTTVNLMAPIVVNLHTGRSAQVILDDDRWPVRSKLHALAS